MQHDFSVILLVAGVGRRLEQGASAPKVMLDMGGESLLARHLTLLASFGVHEVVIVTGYMAETIEAAIARVGADVPVRFVHNPRFRDGSLLSFAAGLEAGWSGSAVVLMDGDVLYDHRMLSRLFGAVEENVLLVDRNIEPGDEPVKVCFDEAGTIVDFRKKPEYEHSWHGESVGFFRFSPSTAGDLANRAKVYAVEGKFSVEYEEAIRDLLLAEPARFHAQDVSDLPWTEIDFPEDVLRARNEILPQLEA